MAATCFGGRFLPTAAAPTTKPSTLLPPSCSCSSTSSSLPKLRAFPVSMRTFQSLSSGSSYSSFLLSRGKKRAVHTANSSSTLPVRCVASDPEQLRKAREDIKELLKTTYCHPILVRLGWHDAGTYNKKIQEWPQCGGTNGS